MRWDRLFADLEARFDELADAEAAAESPIASGSPSVRSGRPSGWPVRSIDRSGCDWPAGRSSRACCARVGPDWLLLTEGQGRDCLVALTAVTAVEGLTASTGPEISGLALRLDLRRALARPGQGPVAGRGGDDRMDRRIGRVRCRQSTGPIGSGELTGTIDRVGADFIEVAVHAAWEPRRAGTVRSVALVPLAGIVLVRALPLG